ncbi:MAG: 4-hydroxy-tetrahydrodipicolinate reductase [Methanosarcinales archaeon]|nr:MAG: 4-hydroxy-tetrahydrodipicolinate reductase [Methanosarcinales archaeon]
MIKVAICGAAGRMGSLIAQNVLSEDDMTLVAAFDVKDVGKSAGDVRISDVKQIHDVLAETKPDVLVDFTVASGAVENAKAAAEHDVNIVIGTTGFTPEQYEEVRNVIDKKVTAVISPNFAVGVNVFWKLIGDAAKYLGDADVEIVEAHHKHKKDAPSGTAKKAAKIVRSALGREVSVHSIRSGDIVGDHLVLFAGDGERLEIKHQAHCRQAFASGVIKAIRWIVSAQKGIFSMNDVLGL